jgi:hypothetical protein
VAREVITCGPVSKEAFLAETLDGRDPARPPTRGEPHQVTRVTLGEKNLSPRERCVGLIGTVSDGPHSELRERWQKQGPRSVMSICHLLSDKRTAWFIRSLGLAPGVRPPGHLSQYFAEEPGLAGASLEAVLKAAGRRWKSGSAIREVRVVGARATHNGLRKVRRTADSVRTRPTQPSATATASVPVSATFRRFSMTADNSQHPRECFPWYY